MLNNTQTTKQKRTNNSFCNSKNRPVDNHIEIVVPSSVQDYKLTVSSISSVQSIGIRALHSCKMPTIWTSFVFLMPYSLTDQVEAWLASSKHLKLQFCRSGFKHTLFPLTRHFPPLCLSLTKCVNSYLRYTVHFCTTRGNPAADGLAFHPWRNSNIPGSFMLQKLGKAPAVQAFLVLVCHFLLPMTWWP